MLVQWDLEEHHRLSEEHSKRSSIDIIEEEGRVNRNDKAGCGRHIVFLWAVIATALMVGFMVAYVNAMNELEKTSQCPEAVTHTVTVNSESGESNPPFGDIELPMFTKDILQGYASTEELEVDLTNMAKHIVNIFVMDTVKTLSQNAIEYEFTDETDSVIQVASVRDGVQENKGTDTTNQEKTADEADLVKNDGNFVYLGYSRYVQVMSHTGDPVTKLYTNTSSESDDDYGYYPPSEQLLALFITEEHVVMVTSFQDSTSYSNNNEVFYNSYDGSSTRVTAYTKPTVQDPDVLRVKTTKIKGRYVDGRWMTGSNSLQILTGTDVSTTMLTDPLNAMYFPWTSRDEYITKAARLAEKKLIPAFVDAVLEGLTANGQVPEMLRLNTWGAGGTPQPSVDYSNSFYNLLRSYMQISSINVNDFAADGEEMEVFRAAFWAPSPSSYAELYGADDSLVVSIRPEGYDSGTVFMLHSKIVTEDGKIRTQFHSAKMLNGNMGSMSSLDVQGNDLRIAIATQGGFLFEHVPIVTRCGNQTYHENPCITDQNWQDCADTAMSCPVGSFVKIGCPYTSFTCEHDGSYTDDNSYTDDSSSTYNYIFVYDIEQQGEMMERGYVRFGEAYEDMTAVRFGETFSSVMTENSFYVLELQPGQAPAVKVSVKVEGYITYLSPLNEEQTMLVGIGWSYNEYGNSVVLINVFDVSDPSDPKVVDSKLLTQPYEGSSFSSSTDLNPRSIRHENGKVIVPASMIENYVDQEASMSNLFLSTANSTEENIFEGFVVFNVDERGIQDAFRVNHYFDRSGQCYPCDSGSLDLLRSFLYDDGTLVTLCNNKLVGTNMTTGVELWAFDNYQERDDSNYNLCCY